MLPTKRLASAVELTAIAGPLVMGEQVCYATRSGSLAITDFGGKILWTARLSGGCHAAPIVADGCLIVGTDDGKLSVFQEPSP